MKKYYGLDKGSYKDALKCIILFCMKIAYRFVL